jgi:hypothetical protein
MPKFLNPWLQALATPNGIKLRSNDVHRLRRFLWNARKKSRDRDLYSLSIILSPHDEKELWIVKVAEYSYEVELTNET